MKHLPGESRVPRLAGLAVVFALCMAAVGAGSGLAAPKNCDGASVFAQWGDTTPYVLFKNGGLESLESHVPDYWKLTGQAAAVAGNEPWKVNSAKDGESLLLSPASSGQDKLQCKKFALPIIRFFAVASGSSGTLEADISYQVDGVEQTYLLATLNASDYVSWAPTPQLSFLDTNSTLGSQTDAAVKLTLIPHGSASWHVDDFYVDPIKHH
jgi:hypothetical protein